MTGRVWKSLPPELRATILEDYVQMIVDSPKYKGSRGKILLVRKLRLLLSVSYSFSADLLHPLRGVIQNLTPNITSTSTMVELWIRKNFGRGASMEQIWSYDREMGKVVEDLDEDRAMKTALINALKSIERIQSRRSNDSRQERLRTMARVALRTDFVFPWKTGVAYKKQVEGKIDERVNVILDLDLDP